MKLVLLMSLILASKSLLLTRLPPHTLRSFTSTPLRWGEPPSENISDNNSDNNSKISFNNNPATFSFTRKDKPPPKPNTKSSDRHVGCPERSGSGHFGNPSSGRPNRSAGGGRERSEGGSGRERYQNGGGSGRSEDRRSEGGRSEGGRSEGGRSSGSGSHFGRSRPSNGRSFDRDTGATSYGSAASSSDTNNRNRPPEPERINLSELTVQGFEHLYGVAPVLNALAAATRDFSPHSGEVDDKLPTKVLPGPRLFVRDPSTSTSTMKDDKKRMLDKAQELAAQLGVPVTFLDKGTLNSLSNNRPNSGCVLRTRPYNLPQTSINNVFVAPLSLTNSPKLWIALDSVVDPQNLGAILRSAYFLSGSTVPTSIAVLICAKNSAPLSPVVSAASAGALELQEIVSTANMPVALDKAREMGWRIVGAAADKSTGESMDYNDFDVDVPTVLVLGSEGAGMRTMVAKACDEYVSVPGGERNMGGEEGVDSLNVSVSAGILLAHFSRGKR